MDLPKDADSNHHSTLEVRTTESHLEVTDVYTSYPEVAPPYPDVAPLQLLPLKYDEMREGWTGEESKELKAPWYRERRKVLWVVLLGLILIAALVGGIAGGLLGRRGKDDNDPSSAIPATPATPTTVPVAAATMSGSATATSGYAYPTPISWGYPHLEVFVSATTSRNTKTVFWKYRGLNSSSTAWSPTDTSLQQLGGEILFDNIGAVARGVGKVDVLVASYKTTAACHKTHTTNANWSSSWACHGGETITVPTVVSWNENRLDMFIIGEDAGLYTQAWEPAGGFGSWTNLRGNWTNYAPTVVSWGEKRCDVFMVEPNTKELYHIFWNDTNTWQPPAGFENLGGYCTSRPAAASWTSGRIDIVVRGGDAGLWHLSYQDSWSNWTSISGNVSVQAEPDTVSWGSNRLDIFAWGEDNSLLHKSLDGTKNEWTPKEGFDNLGGGLGGPPKAVSDAAGSLHVFSISRYGDLQHSHWNETVGKWSPEGDFDDLGTPVYSAS